MSKWEDKYNQYKDGGIDNAISELTLKGISTKEEKKEYRKLTKIKEKMPQIKNIIEYRDELRKELKELKREEDTRENLEKLNKASKRKEELTKEIEEYQERYEAIVKELRNTKLEPDERTKLEDEKNKINIKMPKAQDEMDKQEKILKSGLGKKIEKVDLSKEEIENKKTEIQTKVSKCNLVARNLLDGLNWEQIDIKLDNWKEKTKYTGKRKISKEAKKENYNPEIENVISSEEKLQENEEYRRQKENNSASTFEDKRPWLAKIKNWFKTKFGKNKNTLPEPVNPPKENDKEEKKTENKQEKTFKEYIKEIAEKGMDGLSEEEKKARQEEAKARLEQMRKANRANEAAKFGQDYADKSDYRNKEDDGLEL